MTSDEAMEDELRERIQADAWAYGGTLPREAVIG
jgi:DNA-binding GntR family transcriptional regulator